MRPINQPVLFVFRQVMPAVVGFLFLFSSINTPVQSKAVKPLPDPANYQWESVSGGFTKPVDMAPLPGDPAKAVVVEQAGTIRLIIDGTPAPGLFLDIRDRVGAGASEQGLLGVAFHPNYGDNRQVFVNYTDRNGDTVISRFIAGPDGLNLDEGTEISILKVDQPYNNHNGGGLAFGPDGYLYIALGDGGSAGDPDNNAQNLNSLLGKLLRVDINVPQGYAIPPDNPFAQGGGRPEVWAYGLRNPWKFSFDAQSGDLWIADVGQKLWEEIDHLPAGSPGGENFGWKIREGSHAYDTRSPDSADLIDPIYEYDHNTGCSITGGFVYRGERMPEWQGAYFFGDYCRGTTFGLIRSSSGIDVIQLPGIDGKISSFGVDGAGEIYALEYSNGILHRLEPRK